MTTCCLLQVERPVRIFERSPTVCLKSSTHFQHLILFFTHKSGTILVVLFSLEHFLYQYGKNPEIGAHTDGLIAHISAGSLVSRLENNPAYPTIHTITVNLNMRQGTENALPSLKKQTSMNYFIYFGVILKRKIAK